MVKLTKQNYTERDVSWMYFNHRILEEARREDVPVLERMSFLGIYSNNLDEFFRVRMANLGRVAALAHTHGTKELKAEAEKAAQQLKQINRLNAKYAQEYAQTVESTIEALAANGIRILRDDALDEEQKERVFQYIRLLNEAAIAPRVKSIKTTLYRLAKDSKVIRALTCAALNGKKVTVVIELLARFDEASNISWSKKMQDSGINVIFGVEGLKVHSKITHIGFKSGQDIAVISTGNFHEGNASRYTDVMLMTANRNIVQDVERVFRFIAKPYSPVKFKQLFVSPNEMKDRFLRLIDTEIENHLAGKPAWIKMKVNHITEPRMVQKLYEAVESGVRVEALVRGNCSLVDSDDFDGRLKIVGIIDRYLEHSRIFIFANGGSQLYFIGSADWMPHNLDCRVEVVTPIYDPDIQRELLTIVDYGLCDTKQGRLVAGDLDCDLDFRSQEELYKHYNEKEAPHPGPLPHRARERHAEGEE